MGEQIAEHEELLNETQEVQIKEDITPETENVVDTPKKAKIQFTKKKIIIIAAAVVAVIAVALVLFIPSKFERVESECLQIAGRVTGNGDYFMIDTYPDDFENMDPVLVSMLLRDTQSDALEAIRYANKELGFNGSVYSRMLETTALMGRQSEENDNYKVSWTYHPDDGLEVTYEKKH